MAEPGNEIKGGKRRYTPEAGMEVAADGTAFDVVAWRMRLENGLSIAKGEVAGTTFIHKFGSAPDLDTADGVVTVWDGADDDDLNAMAYTYSSTADIDSVSSSSASDTFDLEVQGLDANYNLVIQTVALTGQTRKALTTPLLRVFRMKNVNSADNIGHIYCYVNTALTSGKPTDATKARAVMQPGNNQTLMAIYTVPAGKTAYMRDYYGAVAGASKASNYIMDLRARPVGGVFQLKHRISLADSGTSYLQHRFTEPEVFAEKTDIAVQVALTAAGATGAAFAAGFDLVLVDN